jgi:D-xylose reductase
VHAPAKIPLHKTWAEMEKLVNKGYAKSIGVSNYNAGLVWEISRYANIMPATLQIEHHPYLTQEDLVNLAKRHGITITAYSSFGPMSYIEMGVEKQNAKNTPPLLQHDTVKAIGDKHGKTPAQVLLRWATQRGIAVIPKSNDKTRLAQNLDVCSFDLAEDEIKKISALNQNIRFNNPVLYGFDLPIF